MKIGCCLAYYKNHNNYGTSLQGYSTVKVLQTLVHEVRIIKYIKNDCFLRKLQIAPLQLISGGYKAYIRKIKKVNMAKKTGQYAVNMRIRTDANNRFKDENMEGLCDEYIGYKNLQKGAFNYDAVMVGSDQVWTPLGLYSNFFNLRFVADQIRKISYASSFGVSVIPFWQRSATCKFLNRIDFLSVREIKAKEIVDFISCKKAHVVCDPTLLRTREEWIKEFEKNSPKAKGDYIFCYLLGDNIEVRTEITRFANAKGMEIVTLRHTDEYIECDETFGDKSPYDVNPMDFLQLINNAKYVFTDSFHCCVFSTLFNKQFVTFYRFCNSSTNSRNSRIDSFLSIFGLENRLFSGDLLKQVDMDIDYKSVNAKITDFREESLKFLQNALK